ncbi:DUF2157 domain-containing protein [Flavobacterium amnicola]|uniref:DUF2157 domain-containing protein n=1 Tax=Flavobacterium amnicola TaxID=2506422 RepID=A0A4Q1K2D4_9FLAO|nr:DUF2157 domain-containing protein [Flavobacterium amnicola]RXR19203.1 DUF2157 domain-containing protein [Flavobacterium amnicola]
MSNAILKELPELVAKKIISEEVAQNIKNYYQKNPDEHANKLFTIFGIIGALLGGLGVILILAHNWDDFSVFTKTIFSVIPLLLGQLACFFTLIKKPESVSWRESSATFLLFAIAASISLVAQVYNINGDFPKFLLTWILLSLPLIYIMRSSFVSLLCIAGITWYCSVTNYGYPRIQNLYCWLLLLAIIPHYYSLLKELPKSNFTRFHHWFLAATVLICFPSIALKSNSLMIVGFTSLLAIYYFIGKQSFFLNLNQNRNGYWFMGKVGTLILLFTLSFKGPWTDLQRQAMEYNYVECSIYALLFLFAGFLVFKQVQKVELLKMNPIGLAFILITILYFICPKTEAGFLVTITNLFILLIGVYEIRKGSETYSLYKLNFGLVCIAILIICRFFDTEMSFIIRGLLFIGIGFGFFLLNYYLLKKRKQHEK